VELTLAARWITPRCWPRRKAHQPRRLAGATGGRPARRGGGRGAAAAELAERLGETLRSRAAEGDYHALFAAARDSAAIAPDTESRARALLQQVVALGRMADDGDAVARLERALSFCDDVLTLGPGADLVGHATRLRGQVVQRLAPALAEQAEALLRARATAWQASPADDPSEARDLAAAFGRVTELGERAQGLEVAAVAAKVQALAEAAEKFRRAALARADGGEHV